jgi:NADH:ubiquinone oxidoreductase subunit D
MLTENRIWKQRLVDIGVVTGRFGLRVQWCVKRSGFEVERVMRNL